MRRKLIAIILTLALPAAVSAGPLSDAIENAGRKASLAQGNVETRSRARFWTGMALLAGGGLLIALGGLELGDDEIGPDDGEDANGSDDGEDSDGWGDKAFIGGGIASAVTGGFLLMTAPLGPRVVRASQSGGDWAHSSILGSGEVSDLPLARRVIAGDEAAFDEFFERYFPRLFRFALARLENNEDATEEIVQHVLIRALERLHT